MVADIYERQADLCTVFSNPRRLRILEVLEDGTEHTVSEIQQSTGLPQSTVSRHLKLMRDQGAVQKRDDGVYNHCALADERIATSMHTMREVLLSRIEREGEASTSSE